MVRCTLSRRFVAITLIACALIPWAATNQLNGEEVEIDGRRFTIPDGTRLQRVAGPPLVMRPICADFDPQGRLYVADSSGSNENVQEQLKKKPHRIVRLTDSNGDGVFDQSTVFADKMMFPEGTLFHDGSLYVSAPPAIWKLMDLDDDGVADRREVWFDGKTLTGCANDLHGPYLGRDGWIYWCKGAFAEQTYERPGKKPWVTRAAHIFRRRPEGGVIEHVMTGGMDNPVEVVFTPGGERIFTTTFLQHPAGGRRDGMIHAVYGAVYGKVHSVIDDHPQTGGLLPAMTHLGAAAPCGLSLIESNAFGEGFRNNLLACSFNLRKISRHILEEKGATFTTVDQDLLWTDDLDFHPTDVLEDADGSLIVIDTGGWYKLCCPTSQLEKPDVLGAIYRLSPAKSRAPQDPRGNLIPWETLKATELAQLLGDERHVVRQRARDRLVKAEAVEPLRRLIQESDDAGTRRAAVWTCIQIATDEARAGVRLALTDKNSQVRQAAAHGASVWRDPFAFAPLLDLLADTNRANQRVAAEAIGRLENPEGSPHLLAALETVEDPTVEHSLIYALIEIHASSGLQDDSPLMEALSDPDPRVRRGAMIAVDQMNKDELAKVTVFEAFDDDDPRLRDAAVWIARQHADWGKEIVDHIRPRIGTADEADSSSAQLIALLSTFIADPTVQQAMAELVVVKRALPATRKTILATMANSRLGTLPPSWLESLRLLLVQSDSEMVEQALLAVRQGNLAKTAPKSLTQLIDAMANDRNVDKPLRTLAAATIPGGMGAMPDELFTVVKAELSVDVDIDRRLNAIDALVNSQLNESQRRMLLTEVRRIGPMELGPLLNVYQQAETTDEGLLLIDALRESRSAAALPAPVVVASVAHLSAEVREQADDLLKEYQVDNEAQQRKLQELLESLPEGDVRRGQQVFNSAKTSCIACHSMGYLGGKAGPDLTRIGKIRSRKDLLESIVFPNASFVRSYEPIVVTTTTGRTVTGIPTENDSSGITLIDTQRRSFLIPRSDIEEVLPGKQSIMPSGLDQQLTEQELSDLISFLQVSQ